MLIDPEEPEIDKLIAEFRSKPKPDFRFDYPIPLFSGELPNDPLHQDRFIGDLVERNSFLRYARPTDVRTMLERTRSLEGIKKAIEHFSGTLGYPGMRILSLSYNGGYFTGNEGKGKDIDADVFFEGSGFSQREIPISCIRDAFPRNFRRIPERIEKIEIIAIGDRNAVCGEPCDDSFVTTTGRENAVPVTVTASRYRNIPVHGLDFGRIPYNKGNLLRLIYDLLDSAIRRYNKELNKRESKYHRFLKCMNRIAEARAYLEQLIEESGEIAGMSAQEFYLPQKTSDFQADKVHASRFLAQTLKRYFDFTERVSIDTLYGP